MSMSPASELNPDIAEELQKVLGRSVDPKNPALTPEENLKIEAYYRKQQEFSFENILATAFSVFLILGLWVAFSFIPGFWKVFLACLRRIFNMGYSCNHPSCGFCRLQPKKTYVLGCDHSDVWKYSLLFLSFGRFGVVGCRSSSHFLSASLLGFQMN